MLARCLLKFLLDKQRILGRQYDVILRQQEELHLKLGHLAVSENLLSEERAEELNLLQKQTDRRFGELAIEKGYLKPEEIDHLLHLQGDSYLKLSKALSASDILSTDEVESYLADFALSQGFTQADVDALRSSDIDRIIPLFVEVSTLTEAEYVGIAIRNIIRFITTNFMLEKIQKPTEYSFANLACQEMKGEKSFFLAFASQDDALLEIAEAFAKEDFEEMDADAFDAVCEFINCVNGLFAAKLSGDGAEVEIEPPGYTQQGKLVAPAPINIIPITINHRQVELIVAIDNPITIV